MNKLSIAVNGSDHLQGSLDAPRVLVQYGDYECPACGAAFPIVKRLQEYLGDKLLFVYRNFPLREVHPHAEHAAETAEFAAAHGNFWEMHDLLYENQENLEDESLFGFAAAVGLSPNELWRSLEAEIYRDRIDNYFRGGVRWTSPALRKTAPLVGWPGIERFPTIYRVAVRWVTCPR